jgi:hypothetical protein
MQQQQLQQQLQTVQFQSWVGRIDMEKAMLQQKYEGVLTEADLDAARDHMLTGIRNTEIPLEQAVLALHGQRIMDHHWEKARQDALAEISGRKPSPPTPTGNAHQPSDDTPQLEDGEKEWAKLLGIKESDYAANKRR